jgi:hypothetical protein
MAPMRIPIQPIIGIFKKATVISLEPFCANIGNVIEKIMPNAIAV